MARRVPTLLTLVVRHWFEVFGWRRKRKWG
jgi:hypothetical protein